MPNSTATPPQIPRRSSDSSGEMPRPRPANRQSRTVLRPTNARQTPSRQKSEPLGGTFGLSQFVPSDPEMIPLKETTSTSNMHHRRNRPTIAVAPGSGNSSHSPQPLRRHQSNDLSGYSSNSPVTRRRRSRASSFDSDLPLHFDKSGSLPRLAHPKGTKKKIMRSTMKSWVPSFLLLIGIAFISYFAFEYHQLHRAHHQLHKSHNENKNLLKQYDEAKEARQVKIDEVPPKSNFRQWESLEHEVDHLRELLREDARNQIHDTFPSSLRGEMQVELYLEGIPPPVIFSISQEEVPYTVWTWLDQVRRGHWTRSKLTHIGDNDFIEITTSLSADNETPMDARVRNKRLEFVERAVFRDEEYVLGIRNPPDMADHGLIMSIHLSRGSCGEREEEVCIGTITKGQYAMKVLMNLKQPMIVRFSVP